MNKQKNGVQYLKGIENPRTKNRTGEKYINTQGHEFQIIKYNNANDCHVMFNDGTILKGKSYIQIKKGEVKNPNEPSILNIGYIGQGIYNSFEHRNIYNTWSHILKRCYSEEVQKKYPTYKDVTVSEEWHCFQNFAQWYEKNYNPETMQGWHIDKDILIKGNKIYSSETCCFVPNTINILFIKRQNKRGEYPIGVILEKRTNRFISRVVKNNIKIHLGIFNTPEEAFEAYKTAKEKHIKEVAEKYKNQITEEVYEALYNYQVEITD